MRKKLETAPGEVERVVGAFTAIESAVEALVERDVFEPVRRANAARRGRGADGASSRRDSRCLQSTVEVNNMAGSVIGEQLTSAKPCRVYNKPTLDFSR